MEERFVLADLGHYCEEDMAEYWGKPGSREQGMLLFSFPFFHSDHDPSPLDGASQIQARSLALG